MSDYYSLEQAAKAISKTSEWLLQQMVAPDMRPDKLHESFLTPSVYYEKPILLKMRVPANPSSGRFQNWCMEEMDEAGKLLIKKRRDLRFQEMRTIAGSLPVWLNGWFNVEGMEEPGKLRNGNIYFKGSRYLCLTYEDDTYGHVRCFPCDEDKISVSKLHIQKEELELFARLTRREIILDPLSSGSQAGKALKSIQTAEVDGLLEQILKTIRGLVDGVVAKRGNERTINHIRIIAEAGVPPEKRDYVLKKVKSELDSRYKHAGFMLLARRPKDDDPYLLP